MVGIPKGTLVKTVENRPIKDMRRLQPVRHVYRRVEKRGNYMHSFIEDSRVDKGHFHGLELSLAVL
jgi:hypothetical protein